MATSSSPPRPCLAVRVGVTGHRARGLEQADSTLLPARIREVLEVVRATTRDILAAPDVAYAAGPPLLRVISPLAEGADRLVAQAGLALGFALQCPLPFSRDEYAQDFTTPASRTEYRALLEQATAVFELDGTRSQADAAYEAVGRMVLRHSDVLIAIWDGAKPAGQGGTGQIVDEALRSDLPVVWIHAHAPHDICVLTSSNNVQQCQPGLAALATALGKALTLPLQPSQPRPSGWLARLKELVDPPVPSQSELRQMYFAERQRRWTLGGFFKVFRDGLAEGKWRCPKVQVDDFIATTTAEWQAAWNASPDFPYAVSEQVNTQFREHYAWADKLANYYADLYRSSFILIYLLGSFAVFFALLGFLLGWGELVGVVLELIFIGVIVALYWCGNHQHWHDRWIDYRLLAEQLRHMRFLAPLGRRLPSADVPAYHTYGDPRNTWVSWHFRALVRAAGMVQTHVDTAYLDACRTLLIEHELSEQIAYHDVNAHRFHTIDHRLHYYGFIFFALTLAFCSFHLLLHLVLHFIAFIAEWVRSSEHHETLVWWLDVGLRVLTVGAAVLPAFGAAIYGIRSQGEFQRITKRSQAMGTKLREIETSLAQASAGLSATTLGQTAEQTADVMLREILDWRIVFQDKPLVLPG